MDLRRLEWFVAAADAGSFRQAAERLEVQISSLSRAVATLEDELGVSLFTRGTRGARLTEVGRNFLIDVRRILADVDQAREAAQSAANGRTGRLRLGICEDAVTPIFARVLAAFRERNPDVTLHIFEMPSAMQPGALRRDEIEAGVLLPPVATDGIQLDDLWRDPWAVAFPSGHPLSEIEPITIVDVARFDIITSHPLYGPGCHDQAHALFTRAGVSPRIAVRVFHRQTMLALVQSGAGVTLVPGSFVGMAIEGLTFIPLQTDDPGMRVAAAFPEGDIAGVVAQFLRTARAVAMPQSSESAATDL